MEKRTLELIQAAGLREFMEKGFQGASLRNIVKEAGVTTGAFYGYFDSKEALFASLVEEQYTYFMDCFRCAQSDFAALPQEEQPENLASFSGDCMFEMLHYAYQHLEVFHLLLLHAEGTRYARMLDEMVEIEVKGTHDYIEVLERLGRPAPSIDPHLEHILITGMFNTFFEIIIHEMPMERAEHYLREMRAFYTAGWMKIMGQ